MSVCSDVAQETASRGLGLIYDLTDKEHKKDLVVLLSNTLLMGRKLVSVFSLEHTVTLLLSLPFTYSRCECVVQVGTVHNALLVCNVYCIQCVLCTVCIVYSVYCVQCVLCTMCIVYSVYCIQCVLCTVCIVYSVYCVLCVLCTVCIVYSVYCLQYVLYVF